jgi:hypothetical protein
MPPRCRATNSSPAVVNVLALRNVPLLKLMIWKSSANPNRTAAILAYMPALLPRLMFGNPGLDVGAQRDDLDALFPEVRERRLGEVTSDSQAPGLGLNLYVINHHGGRLPVIFEYADERAL